MKSSTLLLAAGLATAFSAATATVKQNTSAQDNKASEVKKSPTPPPKTAATIPLTPHKELTVEFKPGSAELSIASQNTLRGLGSSLKADRNFDKIIIAAWGDVTAPMAKGANLSDHEKTLAEQRGQAIKKILNQAGTEDVKVYSMAEFPSWLADNKGPAGEMLNKTIADKGGPSKAVVIAQRKEEKN